jgi:chromosome segregation ATPase
MSHEPTDPFYDQRIADLQRQLAVTQKNFERYRDDANQAIAELEKAQSELATERKARQRAEAEVETLQNALEIKYSEHDQELNTLEHSTLRPILEAWQKAHAATRASLDATNTALANWSATASRLEDERNASETAHAATRRALATERDVRQRAETLLETLLLESRQETEVEQKAHAETRAAFGRLNALYSELMADRLSERARTDALVAETEAWWRPSGGMPSKIRDALDAIARDRAGKPSVLSSLSDEEFEKLPRLDKETMVEAVEQGRKARVAAESGAIARDRGERK